VRSCDAREPGRGYLSKGSVCLLPFEHQHRFAPMCGGFGQIEARIQGKKLAAAHHDFRVQILNVAALLPTRDSKAQMPNVKRRQQEGLTMFSHVVRGLGAHQCIGSRASDLASELRDLGGAPVIAATAINAEVPISTETICRSIETKGA
jgi:hypothetical protein